jgi:hypothetical protein
VARQNGKTELLLPHILERLREGRRILHCAQTRELPRILFNRAAPIIESEFGQGPGVTIRRSSGQETIELPNGGFYKIAAATAGGPRGLTVDDLLLDEVRELDEDFMSAVLPTTVASMDPQVLYLSNAGHDETHVLNAIRQRSPDDPSLAYLEWSAPGALAADDINGWLQANPAIGHRQGLLENLGRLYRSHKLAGTLASFETENLCRWVATLRERFVPERDWLRCRGELEPMVRPSIGVSTDPAGKRASIAMAWQMQDGIAMSIVHNSSGSPFALLEVGNALRDLQLRYGAQVAYDPLTDAELAKFVRKGKAIPIAGGKFANASAGFVQAVTSGRLRWQDADAVTDDLTWTARQNDGSAAGSYHAVRAQDDRPITAALAAIRAAWLASGPVSPGRPRIR